jgi:RNA polymerase sigma factor (sigma-70 family)
MTPSAGEADAVSRWEAVYRRESPRLWRSLWLATGSRDVASDAVSEAFAQGIARGDAVKDPQAWVWTAAFAIARGDLGRDRQRHVETHEPPASADGIDLSEALLTLSARQRTCVVLHYYAGYQLNEIAAMLGTSKSAIGVHLFRARTKLRRELGDEDERRSST